MGWQGCYTPRATTLSYSSQLRFQLQLSATTSAIAAASVPSTATTATPQAIIPYSYRYPASLPVQILSYTSVASILQLQFAATIHSYTPELIESSYTATGATTSAKAAASVPSAILIHNAWSTANRSIFSY